MLPLLRIYSCFVIRGTVWCLFSDIIDALKVRKVTKIRIRYNQVPHLTQDYTKFRYLDNILHINNIYFDNKVSQIYPSELQLLKAITSDTYVSNVAEIRNGYNQVPHLNQDTNRKVTNSQLDTRNERQEVSPFPAGDNKEQINRRTQRHSKHKTEKNTKEVPPWISQ